MNLAQLIATEYAEWESPIVEGSMFDVTDPEGLAVLLEEFCERHLGARVSAARFYRVSVGCVAGLDLEDGRQVVLKAQRAQRGPAFLEACSGLRGWLRARGYPCPANVLGPTPLHRALVTVESLEEKGQWRDAHDPAIRREIARSLSELVRLATPYDDRGVFGRSWFFSVPDDKVWPRPHSPLFDFEATAAGAEPIDAIAKEARARRFEAEGTPVVGHFDFRVEHLRFEAGRVVATYDWDSVHRDLEPVVVGLTARNFTADFQRDDLDRSPSLEEMHAFVRDYEEARGAPFTRGERLTAGASAAYAMAYMARCHHALGAPLGASGDPRPRLEQVASALISSGLPA